jgi:hypothetical protein
VLYKNSTALEENQIYFFAFASIDDGNLTTADGKADKMVVDSNITSVILP